MEEEEGEEDESKASSSATTTYARGRNEDEKPVEMNNCFPVLQHNRDASWGRTRISTLTVAKTIKRTTKKENKEVQLFRKVLEKVSGKEPRRTRPRINETSFLKGSCAGFSNRALIRRWRWDANRSARLGYSIEWTQCAKV